MKKTYKLYYYLVTLSIAVSLGAFFYLVFLLYRSIIFPVMVSMKLQYLEKKNLVVLKKSTVITMGYTQEVDVEDEETCLENVFFITKEFMQITYKRFLFTKFLLYIAIFLFALWNMKNFGYYFDFFNFIKLFFLLTILWEMRTVYILYGKIKYEEYEIKKVVINGKNYYTGYFEIKNKKERKIINLIDAIM